MNASVDATVAPGSRWAHASAARKFQRAPPDVFGFGVITATSGLIRSDQSRIAFGLPLRTRKTIVLV